MAFLKTDILLLKRNKIVQKSLIFATSNIPFERKEIL